MRLHHVTVLFTAVIASASAADPVKVFMLSGSDEYNSKEYLEKWGARLSASGAYQCEVLHSAKTTTLPLAEKLATAQVFVTYTHRFQLDEATLKPIKDWCQAGKPIIALRTASHGYQTWLEFDKLVLGGNYNKHGSQPVPVSIFEANKSHPLLAGVEVWQSRRLYTNLVDTLPAKANLLLTAVDKGKTSGLAWFNEYQLDGGTKGRAFYTSGGVEEDWAAPGFNRLLDNAIAWVRQPVSAAAKP